MPLKRFEPLVPLSERSLTKPLDRATITASYRPKILSPSTLVEENSVNERGIWLSASRTLDYRQAIPTVIQRVNKHSVVEVRTSEDAGTLRFTAEKAAITRGSTTWLMLYFECPVFVSFWICVQCVLFFPDLATNAYRRSRSAALHIPQLGTR
jgi:hypothetical protein